MTIWLDLEDLVRYFHHASRPTGIQRLTFEVSRELWNIGGPGRNIRFCRHAAGSSGFRSIHFPSLEAGIAAAAAAAACAPAPADPVVPPSRWKPDGIVMRVANSGRRLPPGLRRPIGVIGRAVVQIMAELPDLARAARHEIVMNSAQRAQIGGHGFDLDGEDVAFAPGDWIVNLGANWETPYPASFFETLESQGVKLAILAHDLIPELFPEWAVRVNAENFRAWLRSSVMAAQVRFAVSKSTATDLTACMKALDRDIPPPVVLPIGYVAPPQTEPEAPLMLSRPYVLLVSTIEIRKNHALMFRIWRQLLLSLPADQVPDLIFAGKVGWLTADLMQQLENTAWLDGKIKFIPAPSDDQLSSLYRHCMFTVFPSLYEGWGLPVTESLSFGKIVAASDRASIPEAGGPFCVYYDPENLGEAFQVIKGLIENLERVKALEARIAADFHPPSWADTARAILAALPPAAPEAVIEQPAVAWMPSK